MKNPPFPTKPRTAADRADKQAQTLRRAVLVHRMLGPGGSLSVEHAKALASELGVSERSVYRIRDGVRKAYELLGSDTFDK